MSSNKPWRFVVLHEPGWSAGGGHPNNAAVQAYLQPLFVQYGVSIVFTGHNHYYARAVVDGVNHITTGGGGGPLHTPVPGSRTSWSRCSRSSTAASPSTARASASPPSTARPCWTRSPSTRSPASRHRALLRFARASRRDTQSI
ncbi:MAG: hypothetical protein IPP62_16195 [bacterium]|nr:hypothetical protein [bacterium]